MGGRGASSGISDKGNKYGTQYHTILEYENIKFVSKNYREAETMMETMTQGRIYVIVGGKEELRSIIYFDNDNKRVKRIDLDHEHKKEQPHVHRGYFHHEYDENEERIKPTPEEKEMVDRVNKIWDNYLQEKR